MGQKRKRPTSGSRSVRFQGGRTAGKRTSFKRKPGRRRHFKDLSGIPEHQPKRILDLAEEERVLAAHGEYVRANGAYSFRNLHLPRTRTLAYIAESFAITRERLRKALLYGRFKRINGRPTLFPPEVEEEFLKQAEVHAKSSKAFDEDVGVDTLTTILHARGALPPDEIVSKRYVTRLLKRETHVENRPRTHEQVRNINSKQGSYSTMKKIFRNAKYAKFLQVLST